ncbi:hypothetical protein B0J12DRAFT_239459 [Macrophomina phaseolina]|uniref:Uncharacterized protein n=1 Tax=Macrophomina phaseolina TaxID=35725 RepID=A0ABQ8GQM6_9PEZI|nr:hypothetical protein B0J12DRAFT_239459 [Macrophomina phaseolina]
MHTPLRAGVIAYLSLPPIQLERKRRGRKMAFKLNHHTIPVPRRPIYLFTPVVKEKPHFPHLASVPSGVSARSPLSPPPDELTHRVAPAPESGNTLTSPTRKRAETGASRWECVAGRSDPAPGSESAQQCCARSASARQLFPEHTVYYPSWPLFFSFFFFCGMTRSVAGWSSPVVTASLHERGSTAAWIGTYVRVESVTTFLSRVPLGACRGGR